MTLNNIKFRKAEMEDLGKISALNCELLKNEYENFDKTLDVNWSCGENGLSYFRNRVGSGNSFLELAEAEGRTVGYLCGSILDKTAHPQKGKHAELESVFVTSEFRGNGVGERLVKNFFNWCEANGVKHVSVTANTKNESAVSFYKKLGLKDYGLILDKEL